jgi:hypothetical protein
MRARRERLNRALSQGLLILGIVGSLLASTGCEDGPVPPKPAATSAGGSADGGAAGNGGMGGLASTGGEGGATGGMGGSGNTGGMATGGTGGNATGGMGGAGGNATGGMGGAGGNATGGGGAGGMMAMAPDFSLMDVNPNSQTGGQPVSPRDYLMRVSAWYFGHAT